MTCSIDWPCGKNLRVEVETETHLVLACVNGHHYIQGTPPPLSRPSVFKRRRPKMKVVEDEDSDE